MTKGRLLKGILTELGMQIAFDEYDDRGSDEFTVYHHRPNSTKCYRVPSSLLYCHGVAFMASSITHSMFTGGRKPDMTPKKELKGILETLGFTVDQTEWEFVVTRGTWKRFVHGTSELKHNFVVYRASSIVHDWAAWRLESLRDEQ